MTRRVDPDGYAPRRSFTDRAEGQRRDAADSIRLTDKAMRVADALMRAAAEHPAFNEANFYDPAERRRMVEWLDERGLLRAQLGPAPPGMPEGGHRDAAEFVLAHWAALGLSVYDDELLRCFELGGLEGYHRETTIDGEGRLA